MQEMVTATMVVSIVAGSLLFVGWVFWMVLRRQKERQQNEIELRTRMLDKFGTSDEFIGFMQTDAGRKFLETSKSRAEKSNRKRVASTLSWGAVMFMFGLSFFLFAWVEAEKGPIMPGAIFVFVGIGLALSAYFYHRLVPDSDDSGE